MTAVLSPAPPAHREPTSATRRGIPVVVGSRADFSALLDAARTAGRTVGLVPTMGALHDGHRSLVERAAAECDTVAVSIFVNPTQFGEAGDLAAYPRTPESDLALLTDAGAAVVFAPTVTEMYPGWPEEPTTSLPAPSVGRRWEGASRPGHFDGVATVVVKLLSAAGRCRAYFGEKDYQQLAVVRQVVRDLALPVEVVGCATVRDPDGLALSSRNLRLSAEERRAALSLSRALRSGATALARGACAASVEAAMADVVAAEPEVSLDYAALVDADDLEPVVDVSGARPLRLLIAATVGPVRLIDNLDPLAGA